MKEHYKAMSQKAAREGIGEPSNFSGGVYVTKNGSPELFIMTAEERAVELAEHYQELQDKALIKLLMMSHQDIQAGHTYSLEQALERLGGNN